MGLESTSDPSEGSAVAQQTSWHLAVVAPGPRARIVSLESPITIGRGAGCDVQIASSTTSREHARVGRDGPICVIRDLGSRNGVFVDGARIDVAPVTHGSVIRAGGCVGVVMEGSADPQPGFSELALGLYGGKTLAAVVRQARLAAKSGLNIVLEGESGSGKERFARAVHDFSGRSGAFVAINCSALPPTLAESELFGYQRGAFTGAERSQGGYLRAAAGGTLFLDELLELSHEVQAKLLRAVERREVIPLGATTPIAVDIRIVAASQIPMTQAVAEGRVRADLFARLNGLTIRIPPLRERREDVLPLFHRFLEGATHGSSPALPAAVAQQLCLHPWPLNVRELEAVANRIAVLHAGETAIGLDQLVALIGPRAPQPRAQLGSGSTPREPDPEWQSFVDALAALRGNVVQAAGKIGISRQRAYRLLAHHPEFNVAQLRRAN
jgi:transcriptional regulator of acetoin/glycerol metabolism